MHKFSKLVWKGESDAVSDVDGEAPFDIQSTQKFRNSILRRHNVDRTPLNHGDFNAVINAVQTDSVG